MSQATISHPKSRAHIAGMSVVAVLLVTASLGLSAAAHYANGPVAGTVRHVAATTPTALDMAPAALTTAYASFTYPNVFHEVAAQPPTGPVLASYNLSDHALVASRLAVSIVNVPSGRIADNNAYQFRKLNPNRYQESQLMVDGTTVPVMADTTAHGFSRVAFLAKGSYQATVALYGDDQQAATQLERTLGMVLTSWHWR